MSKQSGLSRLSDIPVVFMLAWAGWLAVPWSFSGLAQARAAAAEAAEAALPPADLTPAHAEERRPSEARSIRYDHSDLSGYWGTPVGPDVSCRLDPPGALEGGPCDLTPPGGPGGAHRLAAEMLAAERARIAGEVHDAAGHGLAAIAMQAGLALVALDDDPEQARASLLAIKETSRKALTHLRTALDGIEGGPPSDLPALLDGVRAAGLPVDVEPADPDVPAHLEGAVYRVVRESLTNVLRHAGPTRASVRVASDPRAFVVEVADRGAGWNGAREGRGLSTMRARVTAAGGAFAAGPREGGGFRVVARFPHVERT
ncbi:sensor histidine kinase [Nonomuraea longicatena]|uniref:histidine kinase n=1 Tax=Nonomuraea longicatena TaxID=83682 RepID=A0ABP4BAG1_9ACTN